jgi:hypothetical protein
MTSVALLLGAQPVASADSSNGGVDAALVVAVLALVFTIGSFWWIHLKPGRLVSFVPPAYAGVIQPNDFRFTFPVTIYNSAAKPQVVTTLKLTFLDLDPPVAVAAITFREGLRNLGVEDWIHPFSVAGRQTETRFVEFGSKTWAPPVDGVHDVLIEVERRGKWRKLVRFELYGPKRTDAPGAYIGRRRDPADESPLPTDWP